MSGAGGTRRVNGYVIEEAPNGAWWVRRPDRPQQGWRFATKLAALRFAQALRPPPDPHPQPKRNRGAPP